ncbi:CNB1 [Symbiodinium natans]|uniref:CNB1 protein n=1 Tax=Symbiodinium natans TaxID=878477 RepID=A0A812N333_9DINO|nr:CNB1 [Symbiodinium natans]
MASFIDTAFTPPWLYGTVAAFVLVAGTLFVAMKFVGRFLADRQLARVHPPNARRLSTEDFEALCCRTGLTRAEISRLYVSFMKITDGKSHEDADKVIEELPYFEGPLQDRMRAALKLPEKVDFVILATALSVFSERAALDDKMRFLFRMYSSDLGSVSKQDLTNLMDDVLPEFPDDDERNRLIDRAVQGTFEELCGSNENQELGMEQFQMAATPLIGERCTIFF